MLRKGLLLGIVCVFPLTAFAQSTGTGSNSDPGCTDLANAAAAGMAATIQADNQSITQPQSVTSLSCLDNFFNGAGLNVITNLLNPTQLLQSVEGQICSAVKSAWQSAIGSVQCGLTVTGFNMGGFGGLGGGNFCPTLSFGGGGTPVGSMSVGAGANRQSGLYITGQGVPPSGYTMPSTITGLY
jgi:hypothetical protein